MSRLLSHLLVAGALACLLSVPAISRGEDPPSEEKPIIKWKGKYTLNTCNTPDNGFGVYDRWENIHLGQMIAPQRGGIDKGGGFDLVVHFHGHEAVRKEFAMSGKGVVLVGIDLGIGSGAYENKFADKDLFPKIVASVEEKMKVRTGKKNAHVKHLALSSWSAGYGATSQILRQTGGKKIDAVILLDSLHAGYKDGTSDVRGAQIDQFVSYAKDAMAGRKFMYLSHSSIVPPGYASTTEVAEYIVDELGGKLKKASGKHIWGLKLIDKFDKSNFHVRGYSGDDKPDHCAHIGLINDVMKSYLVPKWKTPAGKAASHK